ncbi:hypothetical protein BS47DRAFT_1365981 [Hydnum rufescens UP504]|uniref:Uncharacterized protein n=1 Tax=Hydnum rufescens UP504 TaxID=1448309 RepID=A0A9P6AM33_9AGAM|nr:hypothetical protein BS47DRAFT_1365981 [Hydnum rufescens UP504]
MAEGKCVLRVERCAIASEEIEFGHGGTGWGMGGIEDLEIESGGDWVLEKRRKIEWEWGWLGGCEEVVGWVEEVVGWVEEVVGGFEEVVGQFEEVVGGFEEVVGQFEEVVGWFGWVLYVVGFYCGKRREEN